MKECMSAILAFHSKTVIQMEMACVANIWHDKLTMLIMKVVK